MQETKKKKKKKKTTTTKKPPMERPWRQTPRLSHTSRWLHTGESTCLWMQGQGAAVLPWLLSPRGLCQCLTSIIRRMGHVLQACFTLVLTSEPFCCFRNSRDSSPHTHISSSPEAFSPRCHSYERRRPS